MLIMGVDAALGTTGLCVLHSSGKVIELTKIQTSIKKVTPDESARLQQIFTEFTAHLNATGPDVVVMENSHVNKRNPRTSMGLARVRGVIQLACALMNIPFYTLEPAQIKKAVTGKGNAVKGDVQTSVLTLYPNDPIVQTVLSTIVASGKNKTDDMADALAIAHTYSASPDIAVSA